MSHQARRASSDKQNILRLPSSHMKAKVKSCRSVLSAPVCTSNKPDGPMGAPRRVKRLKTVKERNRIRGKSTVRFNHSHHHGQRTSTGKGCEGGCGHSVSHSKKDKPIARKPSIITEGRLTSIRGLFSHEVRSVDIERLVKAKETRTQRAVQEEQAKADTSCLDSPLIGETGEQEDQESKTSKHFRAGSPEKPSSAQTHNAKADQNDNEPGTDYQTPGREPTTAAVNPETPPQVIGTPAMSSTPSAALNEDGNLWTSRIQHGESVSHEAARSLAARLCRSLDSVPKRRQPPLLTECTEVLLKCLQEKHGSRLQHNLLKMRSYARETRSSSPPSSTPFSRVQADDQSERGGGLDARRSRRKENWESGPSQDRQARPDTPSQWSITVQSPKSSPSFSTHQTSIPDPELFQPQKQPGGNVNIRRYSNALPQQWKHDPDLSFLFQDETTRRTQTSPGPLAKTKDWPPQHQEKIRQGPQLGGSSTVSAFFPPEGFRYEPYYRFPHPSNTYSGPESFGRTHSSPSELGLSPSMDVTMSYLKYWPYT